jgi:hypothetical protein
MHDYIMYIRKIVKCNIFGKFTFLQFCIYYFYQILGTHFDRQFGPAIRWGCLLESCHFSSVNTLALASPTGVYACISLSSCLFIKAFQVSTLSLSLRQQVKSPNRNPWLLCKKSRQRTHFERGLLYERSPSPALIGTSPSSNTTSTTRQTWQRQQQQLRLK